MNKTILCILDGVGIREDEKGNAFKNAKTPNFDYLWNQYPHTQLKASEEAVGLPPKQMGNSEVGHMNIGAGRIIYQELLKINRSIADGTFYSNEVLLEMINSCKEKNTNLHLIGMVSDGGIHSHIEHLIALLQLCKKENFDRVFIDVILDGRDTKPIAAMQFIERLQQVMKELNVGTISTVQGRYYVMNRDRNWDLTRMGYEAIADGESEFNFSTVEECLNFFYNQDLTDEFVKPSVIHATPINQDDGIITYNFRSDRMIQFTRAMNNPDFSDFNRKRGYIKVKYATMTEYEKDDYCKDILVIFQEHPVVNSIGEVLSKLNLKQKRISEFEKRLHITFYFSGLNKETFKGVDETIFERSDVFTYDEKPEMRAYDITDEIIKSTKEGYDFIAINYPNGDAVGHTGIYPAVETAVEHLDKCLGKLINEIDLNEYTLIITADHGNCEQMFEDDGTPNKKHTTNPVPLIICKEGLELKEGKLANISPTILDIMEINKPIEMVEESLIVK